MKIEKNYLFIYYLWINIKYKYKNSYIQSIKSSSIYYVYTENFPLVTGISFL